MLPPSTEDLVQTLDFTNAVVAGSSFVGGAEADVFQGQITVGASGVSSGVEAEQTSSTLTTSPMLQEPLTSGTMLSVQIPSSLMHLLPITPPTSGSVME